MTRKTLRTGAGTAQKEVGQLSRGGHAARRAESDAAIGERIHVIGNSGSGKSTLATRLAEALDAAFVELDALNWLPGWIGLNQTDPDEFERRIRVATEGKRWVVAGSYERFSRQIVWPRLDTVVWLDLPLRILVWRLLRRSWKRWRSRELVWGTNRERFWPQLMIWRTNDSLLGWVITQHARKRRNMLACMSDSRWAHIRFVRLRSSREVEAFAASARFAAAFACRRLAVMELAELNIDRSSSPARLVYGERFNSASWYIDRHLTEGRDDKIAIEQAGTTVTYRELAQRVGQSGNALLGLGFAPGDRMLMVVRDCPEFFYFFWGAIKAGIVPVPVSYLMRARDLAFMIDDSRCRAVVYSPEFAAEVVPGLVAAGTGARGLALDAEGGILGDVAAASPELEAAPARPEDIAFWLYSSGTTGRPKGVPHRHRDMPATCEHYAVGILGLGEDDRCYSAAKLFFAYGLGNAMTFPLWVGGTAILDARRPTPESTFETIETLRPTAYFGVPTLYAAQLQALDLAEAARGGAAGQGSPDLSSLRLCVSAGEALPPDLFHRWKAATGLEILDGIGSTEALHIFISNASGDVKPGSTGRVVPGYEARILDEEGAEAGPGEAGQLEIRGDSTTPGYWNRPELDGRTIVDGWLRTGDQYVRDAEGWFHYQGRADDMIKVGGIWCSPFDIEARLMEHPSVLEAAVVGREDDHGLVKPEAHVVLTEPLRETVGAEPAADALTAELVAHCRQGLPRYMYPRWIRFVAALPKTATGKIQRFRLRA